MSLVLQLENAMAEVARLERLVRSATCQERGRHTWKQAGGRNCGCHDGCCSVPVFECSHCGACDYGENIYAYTVRAECPDGPYRKEPLT